MLKPHVIIDKTELLSSSDPSTQRLRRFFSVLGSWRLSTGDYRLEIIDWRLSTGDYRLEIIDSRLSVNIITRDYQINTDKCQFGVPSLQYLGHFIAKHGIHPLADQIKVIHYYLQPASVYKLLEFLGMVNFCRRFDHLKLCRHPSSTD